MFPAAERHKIQILSVVLFTLCGLTGYGNGFVSLILKVEENGVKSNGFFQKQAHHNEPSQ